MAMMDAALMLVTSFIAGIVAHAVWQSHRGATQVGKLSHKEGARDGSREHSDTEQHLKMSPLGHSLSLPASPALPPLLTPTSPPSASLSIPADVSLTHPYPSPAHTPSQTDMSSGTPGFAAASFAQQQHHVHTPGVLLTPPPEAWIAEPEKTLEKVGATDSWGEAVDHIQGEEGEHV
ncbi:hypothetical protein JCM10908_006836 [Rhodotorula pacifica]|uniref:uncharacterized protein n=1 Tax=Rhodotorula pacifica TaxID=1495444 RepID=UPI00317CAEBE